MKETLAALLLVAATAPPLCAQSTSPMFVRASGGVTFVSETGGLFGAAFGVRLTGNVDVIGEMGHFTNILPRLIQHDIDAAARLMGTFYGAPLTIDARAPALYGMGGLRASHAAGERMRVFVEGSAGLARGTSDISAHAGGADVSREVAAALRIKHSERHPLVALGAGVAIPLTGHLGLDLGYRYMRIFTDDPRINTGVMSAGCRWGF